MSERRGLFFIVDTEEKVQSPWFACTLFILTGYLFYFSVLLLPQSNSIKGLIDYTSFAIKAIDTAARVAALRGYDALPSQITIFYCAFGSIVLAGWFMGTSLFNRKVRQAFFLYYQSISSAARPSRIRLFIAGVVGAIASGFSWYVLFLLDTKSITWRDVGFYSGDLTSVTFLLVSSVILALGISFASMVAYVALQTHQSLSKD